MTKEERKPYDERYRRAHPERVRASQAAYRKAHPEKENARGRAYRRAHPEKTRAWCMKSRYGLTPHDFEEILARQDGVCGICETSDWGPYGPLVDHDHTTGVVRGLLCFRCNAGLGLFRDNVQRLIAAAGYLSRRSQ